MRKLVLLLLLAAGAWAGDLADRLYVVRIRTERSTFSGTSSQTLSAPALPVGKEGLLLAVGFSLDPPDNDNEAVTVSAIDPKGRALPARLLGGDDTLECTFFRLTADAADLPEPVPLTAVPLAAGDTLVLLSRHGELMEFAHRRTEARIDAAVAKPNRLFALDDRAGRWLGSVAMTADGRLAGFVDSRATVEEGGLMMGVGRQTIVVVPAEAFADAAKSPPEPGEAVRSRAWIGINLAPFNRDREAFFGIPVDWTGALVTGVAEGSPADKAGIKVHDLVQAIGPLQIRFEEEAEWNGMLRAVQRLPLGKPLKCRVVRFLPKEEGGYTTRLLELTMTLEERPLDFRDAPETEIQLLGVKVKPLTQDWRRTAQVADDVQGVVVTRTARAAPARLAGLMPGDLILRVDQKPVPDVAAFVRLVGDAKRAASKKVVLFVRRGAETLFVPVSLEG